MQTEHLHIVSSVLVKKSNTPFKAISLLVMTSKADPTIVELSAYLTSLDVKIEPHRSPQLRPGHGLSSDKL